MFGVCAAGLEVPCELIEVAAHSAALGKQSGNSGQGLFSAAGNDDRSLDLNVVDGTADECGEGEIDRVCEAQWSNESPSGAFKRQRGLRQQMEGRCPDKRYPNKITSKLARVADVKSRWSTTFSKIENLWPRDGSCPLPLRSKPFLGNCFRIVKAQK